MKKVAQVFLIVGFLAILVALGFIDGSRRLIRTTDENGRTLTRTEPSSSTQIGTVIGVSGIAAVGISLTCYASLALTWAVRRKKK
jgi:hypothetical protein